MPSPAVNLSGTLLGPNNVPAAGKVVLTLVNYGDNPPLISGTGNFAPLSWSVLAAANGTWSSNFWGDDQISPAGTQIQVALYPANANAPTTVATYVFNSGTYDLSTQTPASATPAPPTNAVGANTFYAGPTSGQTGVPVFRLITIADLTAGPGTTGTGAVVLASAPTFTGEATFVAGLEIESGFTLNWNDDTGISRTSAGVLNIGNGTQGDLTGTLNLTNLNVLGATATFGSQGNTTGVITLEGGVTGSATITAPSNSGITNPILFSNSLNIPTGTVYTWNNDTGLSRDSAGVIDVGNGVQGDKSGTVNAALGVFSTSVQIAGATAITAQSGTGGTIAMTTSPVFVTPLLGTPTSGNLANCTFPTLNQSSTGSAASLSVSGQTGLLTVTGLTSTNRIKTVRDAADTILELGGSYTPTGTWTSLTLVTPTLGTPASGTLTACQFNIAAGVYATTAGLFSTGYSGAANHSQGDGTNARRIPMTLFTGYSFASTGNATGFTSLFTTPTGSTGSLTLVANQQTVGSVLHIRAVGTILVSTATMTINFESLLNAGVTSALADVSVPITATHWEYDSWCYCSAVGAANTATMKTTSLLKIYGTTFAAFSIAPAVTSLAATVATTGTQLVDLKMDFGTSEVANTCTMLFAEVTLE